MKALFFFWAGGGEKRERVTGDIEEVREGEIYIGE
jgi:hypothetical protein